MTQTPFDQMSKQYLEEFLTPLGTVQRQYEIPGEAKFVDVWFVPDPAIISTANLGLLGQMVQQPCLLEPYRNIPSRTEARVSLMKLVWVQEDERRKAGVDELPEDEQPVLWILAAKTSQPLLQAANVLTKPDWPLGVYFTGDLFKTAIIAIDQLPETEETLWVRILGRGSTQERAIREVLALPVDEPRRNPILRLLASWKVRMDMGELLDFTEREEVMALSEAFLAWEQQKENQSRQEERQTIALNMLRKSLSWETILEVTGLSIEQLQQLQAQVERN